MVLTSQGIASQIARIDTGYQVLVAENNVIRARETISLWINENQPRPAPPEALLPETQRPVDFAIAYGIAVTLLVAHVMLTRSPDAAIVYRLGSANAFEILDGEFWRVLTALTLHKDLGHALGNTLIGGLFLASLSGRIGSGVALGCALASGAIGNLADALYYQTGHNSIGASTAVFGVVGLLCGVEAWRRQRLAVPWRGAWVPLGAGCALLAMLGSGGPDVDYGAHICGLLAGMLLGYGLAPKFSPEPPRVRAQLIVGLTSLVALALAWRSAFQHAGFS
ncbi:MAG: rhomboid protease GluP [Myxococcota bacterium]